MQDLSEEEREELLQSARFGTLGLAAAGHSYLVPIFYGYDGEAFYFHSHPGLKDDFIDQTVEACLSITAVMTEDDWNSVQVFGKVEKCTLSNDLQAAEAALMDVPLPPEFGFMKSGKPMRTDQHMYFWKLEKARVTGKKSVHHLKHA